MSDINFFSDYVSVEDFAVDVGRRCRTIIRWMQAPNGLPYAKIGNRRLVHIPTAKAWLLSRVRRPNQRRPARQQEIA
jgi:hypothetical protein